VCWRCGCTVKKTGDKGSQQTAGKGFEKKAHAATAPDAGSSDIVLAPD